MSFTPKFHALMDHVCDQIKVIEGFSIMGEDHIKQAHQSRSKIGS